jgi:hypothetical protein
MDLLVSPDQLKKTFIVPHVLTAEAVKMQNSYFIAFFCYAHRLRWTSAMRLQVFGLINRRPFPQPFPRLA